MELLALAAIIAIAAFAGGKKKNGADFKEEKDENGREKKKLVPDKNKSSGNPPNVSEDPEGYNTKRWPDSGTVCNAFSVLGYDVRTDVEIDGEMYLGCPDKSSKFPKSEVKRFQRDYNKVSKNPDYGGIKGTLGTDGVAGKNTLNAMEAAELLGYPWQFVVGKS